VFAVWTAGAAVALSAGAAEPAADSSETSPPQPPPQRVWRLSDERINYLLAGDVCDKAGLEERTLGRKRFWVEGLKGPQHVFSWPVRLRDGEDQCEVCVLVAAKKGTPFVLASGAETKVVTAGDKDWQRLYATLRLRGPEDVIRFHLQGEKQPPCRLKGLEVITSGHLPAHRRRLAELKTPQTDAAWFQDAGYGIMFQWGFWGYPPEGARKANWKDVYREFDIEAFADRMKALDPGYIIWSITWRGSRFAMPLKSMDEVMGSKDYTMEYDFVGKLADALNRRGIKLMLYCHPGAEERAYWKKIWHGWDDREAFTKAKIAIWTEIGQHLGDRLAGWFIDGGQVQYYPADFYQYVKALKAGNPKRLVSFNSWALPNCSPYEDMAMGEGGCAGTVENGMLTDGRNKGLLPHTMLILDGPDWGLWRPNTKINPPKHDLAHWQKRVDEARRTKHPISFCILMYEDGTIGSATQELLKNLKR